MHAGRALSHLVRRKRQVRQACVARFRGYVVAAREGRPGRLWEASAPSTAAREGPDPDPGPDLDDGAVSLRRSAGLSGARGCGCAEGSESMSMLLRCAPWCRDGDVCMGSIWHRQIAHEVLSLLYYLVRRCAVGWSMWADISCTPRCPGSLDAGSRSMGWSDGPDGPMDGPPLSIPAESRDYRHTFSYEGSPIMPAGFTDGVS